MKSRTSCYDAATARMELRRFAPVWILYAIGMLLLAAMSFANMGDTALWAVHELVPASGVINFLYALVLAELLFGDLYVPRLCYAIHSLPITRGGWFGTQIILGLLGSLIPNLLTAGMMLLNVPEFRIVILWWLLAAELQFLFFFGIAVLCAVCTGNRLGAAALYVLAHFANAAASWFGVKLYAPLIYALYLPDLSTPLSPILTISNLSVFDIHYRYENRALEDIRYYIGDEIVDGVSLNGSMLYLAIWAAVGCAAIWLALRLYKKRKLECAGDLLAFRKMELPFLLVATLFSASFGVLVAYEFSWQLEYPMLFLGMGAGYFACLMLLKRKINVFTPKNLGLLAGLYAVLLLSLVLTGLDVLGITYRVPNVEEVASVSVGRPYSNRMNYTASTPEEIEKVIAMQEEALERHRIHEAELPLLDRIFGDEGREYPMYDADGEEEMVTNIYLLYNLKDGSTLKRMYFFSESCASVPTLREIYSRPEYVFSASGFGSFMDDTHSAEDFAKTVQMVRVDCNHGVGEFESSRTKAIADSAEYAGLVNAILADCEAGNAGQQFILHKGDNWPYDYIDFWLKDGPSIDITIYPSCTNTNAWLEEHGFHEVG